MGPPTGDFRVTSESMECFTSPCDSNQHRFAPPALPPLVNLLFAGASPQPVLSWSTTAFAVLSALIQTLPWPGAVNRQHAHWHDACARAASGREARHCWQLLRRAAHAVPVAAAGCPLRTMHKVVPTRSASSAR